MIRAVAVLLLAVCPGLSPAGRLHASPPSDPDGPRTAPSLPRTPEASGGVGDPPVYRYGIALGGVGLVSLVFEYESGNRAIELALGTFAGRDVSLAVTGKRYVGGGSLRAFAGIGLWGVAAFPSDQRSGFALIARAPVGVDWHAFDRHAAGLELAFNRALAMRRPDPLDERGPRTRIVPLPAFHYRFADPR